MNRKIPILLGVALVVTLLSISAMVAMSASASTSVKVTGRIKTIDPLRHVLTVRANNGTLASVKVAATTRITRNGSRTTLTGLALHDSVTAQFDARTHFASILSASGPSVATSAGRVNNASLGTGLLTVGSRQFHTTAKTRFSRNGKTASLSQVTRRDSVIVHAVPGTNSALDVLDDGPEEAEVEGTITAIDTTAMTITIAPEDGSPAVTLTVTTTTMIELNDEPATLADLQVNMKADAEYDPTTMTAFSIEAESEDEEAQVSGTVGGVDLTANTITINPDGGGNPITLTVTGGTEIQVNGEDATLADVQVGMPVNAQYDPVTMVAHQIDAGSENGDDSSGH